MSADYGVKFRSARDRVFDRLADLRWHSWDELELVAGNRYVARMRELRRLGYDIESQDIEVGKKYRLKSLIPGAPAVKRVKAFLDEYDVEVMLNSGFVPPGAVGPLKSALGSFQANRGKL